MKKKILIAYATAGIGHKKAGLAIKDALDELTPQDVDATIIDSLDYTNAFFKWTYLKLYLLMVNKLPLLWGLLYYITNNFYVNLAIARLRRFNNWLNSFRLVNYLLSSQPDVVISTHFFASEVIANLKKKGILKSHLVTVVTDYRLHLWWVSDFVDTYVVGGADAKNDLMRWKIDASRIKILGIPVEPIFSQMLDREKILEKTGTKEGIFTPHLRAGAGFTILVIGGGFGVGPIEEIIKIIASLSKSVQTIAICGHNEELVKRLEHLKTSLKIDIKILGFVNNVYDYMDISDILISKAGGITVTESLALELPMIIISPIIGQETRNSDFLVSGGAALRIKKRSDLKNLLEDLTSHPEKIRAMKAAIKDIKKPTACYDIARLAIAACGETR